MTLQSRVVAIVPAKDAAAAITETISSLRQHDVITEIVVVDDGSSDDTAAVARRCGVRVVQLTENVGKGAAMQAGIDACTGSSDADVDVFLFVDADTRDTAGSAVALVQPVLAGRADLAIGVLPSAGGRGGFGSVKKLAAAGISRACGFRARAPLSGQRAIRAGALEHIELAQRFGVEVAMTIDAVRNGAVVEEFDVEMEHHHRGRSIGGFVHRGKQCVDVVRALLPRLIPARIRLASWITLAIVCICLLTVPQGVDDAVDDVMVIPPDSSIENVEVFVVPGWQWAPGGGNVPAVAGSIVTGDVVDVVNAVESGSRDPDAAPIEGVDVTVETPDRTEARDPTTAAPNTIAITVGITTTDQQRELRPLVIAGLGQTGTIESRSTRTPGLADITDIAPTVLALEGRPVPDQVEGRALRIDPSPYRADSAAQRNATAIFYSDFIPKAIVGFVLFQLCLYAYARHRRVQSRSQRPVIFYALAVAAFPVATYLVSLVTADAEPNTFRWSTICAVILGIIVIMSAAGSPESRRGTSGLRRICALTIVVLIADALIGTPMQQNGIFGSSQLLGTRYFGFGNPTTTVLLLALVTWAALVYRDNRHARFRIGFVATIVVFTIGLPDLGADAGGFVAGLAALGSMTVALSGMKLTMRRVIAGISAISVLSIGAFAFDAYSGSPTHIGTTARGGIDGIATAIADRASTNLFGYGFPWSLVVVALAIAVLLGIIRQRWASTLPLASLQRRCVVALMTTAFGVYLLNDSGVVVLALAAVFVGPFVIAVQHREPIDPSAEFPSAGIQQPPNPPMPEVLPT